jgi:anti-sigma regulatory factor (Ser/Thr protein kinase)
LVPTVVLLGANWDNENPAVWDPPFVAWVEVATLSDQAILRQLDQMAVCDLYASFTSQTATRLMLAGELARAINDRWPLTGQGLDDLELALHEALSNALLHGNLQLDSMAGLTLDALDRFSNDLTRRMADPLYANRRVEISCQVQGRSITVDVVDQGSGFVARTKKEGGACGRGLTLIGVSCQAYELLDGGRRIRMRFGL